MELHADIASLGFLVGTWEGRGTGVYPTIAGFAYEETVEITAPPKPFLVYTQRTRRAGSGEPLHMEAGYFRATGPGTVELVIAQPTGIVEAHTGTVRDGHIHLHAGSVAGTPAAVRVDSVERVITVHGDVMRYRLLMGAVGEPHQLHLSAELQRRR
jgi:THAP4-like, heme-binding beta-barrel domain